MVYRFTSVVQPDGISVTLQSRRGLSWHAVSPELWSVDSGVERAAAAYLLRLRDTAELLTSEIALILPHSTASHLPQTIADAIGLPPIAPLSVTLSFEGRVEQADGNIRTRWYDENTRVVRTARTGLQIQWDDRVGRLTPQLLELVEAVDGFNGTRRLPTEARIAAWQPVQEALVQTTGRVKTDAYLESLTIYQAGSFALDVRETANGPDFLPIVMSRSKAASLEDNAPAVEFDEVDGDVERRDQFGDALLPPDLQKKFEQTQAASARDAYVLAKNTFLVIDPDLKLALEVIRRKRDAPSQDRRLFLRNPRPAIAEALSDAGRAAEAITLFVETTQYSERVLGLGAWMPPLLQWLKKRAGQWLPESFPIQIGERTVTLTSESLSELEACFVSATMQDMPIVELRGDTFKTEEVGVALKQFSPAQGDISEEPSRTNGEDAEIAKIQRSDGASLDDGQVLQIKTNIDGVEYHIDHRPRRARISADLPADRLGQNPPKPHQQHGFDWLLNAWASGWPGVLLADDMGLGKTYQALAFLAWHRKNQQAIGNAPSKGPVLIVAPTALLNNWKAEAERHLAPGALGACVEAFGYGIARLKRPKTDDWTPEDALDIGVLRKADWILTTYETLADNHRAFARVAFEIVIFDEMQKIKAPATINTHAAKALNADFVLGITGTPIENRIEDLWCIMDRIAPGYLGDLKTFSKDHGDEDAGALTKLKAKLDEPHGPAPAIMLRRMKETILDGLPTKEVQKYRVTMPLQQADAYTKSVSAARMAGRDRGAMLKAIHAFRGVSLHPDGANGVDPYDPLSVNVWISRSARLLKVVELLKLIRSRSEKAIVFVEDRAVQKVFASAAPLLFDLMVEPAIINGEVPGERRQAIVDRFQNDRSGFDFLVLSPKAAGIGLTITAANHVIHLSRWWNPAVEDQCNDRVYRIGQERPVTIHVPVAVHPIYGEASFDETLDKLLESKRKLSRHMLAPPVQENDVDLLFEAAVGV